MNTPTIQNRKAHHNYSVLEEYVAGIVLTGNEIKSVRDSKCSISEAYCVFYDNELWLRGSYIAEYKHDFRKPDESRDRKLLLTKQELRKLGKAVQQKGYAIVPLKMYFTSSGYLKANIGLCKGKHEYDKREAIKERDIDRQIKTQY